MFTFWIFYVLWHFTLCDIDLSQLLRFETLTYCDALTLCDAYTFWNDYVLKLLHLETLTFRDATLSDINVVWCYVLSQYREVTLGAWGGAGSFWRLIPVHLILPPKPNSHPSLSHLLPPTATLSSLSPGYLPPSFAFFISFAFLFISLSPSHCSLFLYLLLFPFLFPFSLLLMSHYPSHYSLRSFYFRSSSRIIPLSALSTLLLLLTFPSLRYVYALLLHLSSLLFHYSPALKFFYSYASLLIFSHSLLPLLSSTLQLLLYSPSLCLFTSRRWGEREGWGWGWVGRQMRGKGGVRAGMGRKADEGKGRGEGGDG